MPNSLMPNSLMPNSLIGRIGRWCMRHWARVMVVWLLAVVAGVLATGPLFSDLAESGVPDDVESIAVRRVLDNAANRSSGTVAGIVDGLDSVETAQDAVTTVAARIAAIDGVTAVTHPFIDDLPSAQRAAMLSGDRHALIVFATLGDLDRARRDRATAAISEQLHGLTGALPSGATVEVGGGPLLNKQVNEAVQRDLQRGEFSSLPLTLIVLVFVFGGAVAAGVPVLTAAVSVAVAMGAMLGFSYLTDIHRDAVTVVTLLGLALSVDYGLLLVARYREERSRGFEPDVAVARAWATAGRTITFSALTVAAALSGLLAFDLPALTGLGAAGVSIAVVCMLASLTFTAALIGALKRWIRPGRRSRAAPAGIELGERGFFAWLSRIVQRRPITVALVTGIALLAAGAPVLTSNLRLPATADLPRSIEAVRVSAALTQRFGQPETPAVTVVARTTPADLDQWAARLRSDPLVTQVRPARSAGDGIASVAVDVAGDPQAPAVLDLVHRIRADRPSGGESWVTGNAAMLVDLLDLVGDALPVALGVTLLAMILLLFAMTGSLIVPIKAILANLISLGATFGLLTAVFGHGFASSLLSTITTGALNPFIVIILFAFAFGLSMDYEVFLLARVKEYVDAGMDTETAVRRGLQQTGRVITSAALLMVIVFTAFAMAEMGNIEQIGLGLAAAVVIDATIVRCLLVPATMTLLGRWNWWAPNWLSRIRARIGLREHPLEGRLDRLSGPVDPNAADPDAIAAR